MSDDSDTINNNGDCPNDASDDVCKDCDCGPPKKCHNAGQKWARLGVGAFVLAAMMATGPEGAGMTGAMGSLQTGLVGIPTAASGVNGTFSADASKDPIQKLYLQCATLCQSEKQLQNLDKLLKDADKANELSDENLQTLGDIQGYYVSEQKKLRDLRDSDNKNLYNIIITNIIVVFIVGIILIIGKIKRSQTQYATNYKIYGLAKQVAGMKAR